MATASTDFVEIYTDGGDFRWRRVDEHGTTVRVSPDSFDKRKLAKQSARGHNSDIEDVRDTTKDSADA